MDPRSNTLHHLPHVLETPSLIDVSECASPDDIRGEAAVEHHDDSTDKVQRDRAESVSDASQFVAEGGVVRNSPQSDISMVSPTSTQLSRDTKSDNHSSISPFSPGSVIFELQDEPVSRQHSLVLSPGVRVPEPDFQVSSSSPASEVKYACPHCPRTFSRRAKAQ